MAVRFEVLCVQCRSECFICEVAGLDELSRKLAAAGWMNASQGPLCTVCKANQRPISRHDPADVAGT